MTYRKFIKAKQEEALKNDKEEKIDINPFEKIDELISLGYKPNEAIKEVSKLINVNRKELYNDYVEYKNQR